MQSWPRKKPKTMRPSEILPRWFRAQHSERVVDEVEFARAHRLSKDPVGFFRQVVGFKPTKYQIELIKLFQENQFIAARWARQSGKTWIVSALLLWYAVMHADSYIAVVGPSWRQSKLIVRRVTYFLKHLPPGMVLKPQKTAIRFSNGSLIEAFPNNPDTIRGPTLNLVYVDEFNFVRDDEDLYDAILFTISTTNGKFLCTSTPWTTESVFYKIFNHKDYEDFAKSHVTWEQALEPNGPLKKNVLEKIRRQFAEDPWRWKREMDAEWAEDESTWLGQALITKCIDKEGELWSEEKGQQGELYGGLDLGRVQDHSVFVVIQAKDNKLFLRHVKIFPLGTDYTAVIGYIKVLCDRWQTFSKIRIDATNQDYLVEEMKKGGVDCAEGVRFSAPRKQEMATLLKQRMSTGQFLYPNHTWERPYRGEFVSELHVERFELRKDGTIAFNHPQSQHDDTFWAAALAVFSTVEMSSEPILETLKFG
jgi:phage FluMu gp28-like protein